MNIRRPFTPKGQSERQAIESNRHLNMPLHACVGEILDNSIEWGADSIHVLINWSTEDPLYPEQIVFIDNGVGMSPEKLSNSLVTGFHDDDGSEDNPIGKFGVGCKYAFLANCRRSDVFSKRSGKDWHTTRFDLNDKDIDDTSVNYPPDAVAKTPPSELKEYWEKLDQGTITIWNQFDQGLSLIHI